MPSALAVRFASILSPMVRMCSALGPMKVMSWSCRISAKRAFSLRKPYPGWIASAPVISQAESSAGMFR